MPGGGMSDGIHDQRPGAVRLRRDVVVCEAQDVDAVPGKLRGSAGVVGRSLGGVVRLAIHLDTELQLRAVEVENVGVDGVLAPELVVAEITVAKPPPDRVLRPRRARPHDSRPVDPLTTHRAERTSEGGGSIGCRKWTDRESRPSPYPSSL